MIDEISMDRLVLDIPGLAVDAAHELASRIGEGLAAGSAAGSAGADAKGEPGKSGPGKRDGGNFDSLTVELDGRFDPGDLPRLADAIVQSVMRQIG